MRREAQFKNYSPARWHPEFDLIVLESVSGKSNLEIGRQFGYTAQHVSNILSTEEAAKVKERIREQINKEAESTIKERLARIGEQVIKHMETFIEDDSNRASKSPFEFIDRAVKIGQVVGALGKDSGNGGNNTIIGTAIMINNDKANDITRAIEASSSLDNIIPLEKPEELGKLKLING